MFASIWGRCSWNGLRLKVLTKLNCWWTIWTVWLTCFVCFVVSRLVLFHCLKIWNFDEPGSFVIGPPGWFFITCFVWPLWFSGEKYDCWKLLAALTLVDARSSCPYEVGPPTSLFLGAHNSTYFGVEEPQLPIYIPSFLGVIISTHNFYGPTLYHKKQRCSTTGSCILSFMIRHFLDMPILEDKKTAGPRVDA